MKHTFINKVFMECNFLDNSDFLPSQFSIVGIGFLRHNYWVANAVLPYVEIDSFLFCRKVIIKRKSSDQFIV